MIALVLWIIKKRVASSTTIMGINGDHGCVASGQTTPSSMLLEPVQCVAKKRDSAVKIRRNDYVSARDLCGSTR